MIGRIALRYRRRRLRSRRLFFCLRPATLIAVMVLVPGALRAQELPEVRLLQRQVRVMRNEEGLYRIVDAMRVQFDGEVDADFTLAEPLAVICRWARSSSTRQP